MDEVVEFKGRVPGFNIGFLVPEITNLPNGYVVEDGSQFYVTEDGVNVYVTEASS